MRLAKCGLGRPPGEGVLMNGFRRSRSAGTRLVSRAGPLALLVAALCASWAISNSLSPASGAGSPQSSKALPLWASVPSDRFAVLDEGKVGQRRWGAYVYREKGGKAQRACVYLASLTSAPAGGSGAALGGVASCGAPAPPGEIPQLALSRRTLQSKVNGPQETSTVGALLIAPAARRVVLDLANGSSLARTPRILSARQAAKARVQRLAYISIHAPGTVCITRVSAYDRSGSEILRTPERPCS